MCITYGAFISIFKYHCISCLEENSWRSKESSRNRTNKEDGEGKIKRERKKIERKLRKIKIPETVQRECHWLLEFQARLCFSWKVEGKQQTLRYSGTQFG